MKNKILKNRGSALILAVIVLVNALFIVVAVSSISIVERRMSIKTRNTAPAFQAADSGIEYVLSHMDEPALSGICDNFDSGTGECTISLGGLIGNVKVYFLDENGEVIIDGSDSPNSVDSIRSVGRFGEGGYATTRAIEVAIAQTTAGITGGCEIASSKIANGWGDGCDTDGTAATDCSDAEHSGFSCGESSSDICICVSGS